MRISCQNIQTATASAASWYLFILQQENTIGPQTFLLLEISEVCLGVDVEQDFRPKRRYKAARNSKLEAVRKLRLSLLVIIRRLRSWKFISRKVLDVFLHGGRNFDKSKISQTLIHES